MADSQKANLRNIRSWKTDFSKHSVPILEVKSAGLPRDGIPPIDNPSFVEYQEADKLLDSSSPIMVVTVDGETKGYPLSILIWHEIVNDSISSVPIAVTYCPLCSASICFERKVNDHDLTFGTTGSLRNSDLVMYDRQTDSWWQQYTGEGLVGEYTGTRLKVVPSQVMNYATMKSSFKNGIVLSFDTGFSRSYGITPYANYDRANGQPLMYQGKIDNRLNPLERVLGLKVDEYAKVYELSTFEKQLVLNDRLYDLPVLLVKTGEAYSDLDKKVISESKVESTVSAFKRMLDDRTLEFVFKDNKLIDLQTESVWNTQGKCQSGELRGEVLEKLPLLRTFSFAWFVFYPDSDLYKPEE